VIAAVLQLYTPSSVLMLTCMNDLTGAKLPKGEGILFNAFKDIYFESKMKFEKSLLNQAFKKSCLFFIFAVLYVS
jgi:hypothetical protein